MTNVIHLILPWAWIIRLRVGKCRIGKLIVMYYMDFFDVLSSQDLPNCEHIVGTDIFERYHISNSCSCVNSSISAFKDLTVLLVFGKFRKHPKLAWYNPIWWNRLVKVLFTTKITGNDWQNGLIASFNWFNQFVNHGTSSKTLYSTNWPE